MKIQDAYLKGVSPYFFRTGETAKIVGTKIVTPENSTPRLCFKVRYSDGLIDYVALQDLTAGNCIII